MTRLWGLLPLDALGVGLLALQLWAGSEVIGTAGLALAVTGAHFAAAGVWSATALVLWLLMAIVGVGGLLYLRWRLWRRRLVARVREGELLTAPPRISVLSHYGGGLALVLLLALVGWAPWAAPPLYALRFARVV